ncbi:RagB/SusD family nutrient uptake outer membrane protein [Belliella sp. DSM 111904]|uniref:RagB/SusD family nutrient uptake outer membrane protein n=1 Tax=Belliella filtrata TaxID=2923435 RepID=A0ABS9V0Q3_9BACT|nr:RagB/SusD family nutrient uptake outer membrane protein [Belliella filtrata]MCH7409982.1 RagB/SusD family nutrient uptake outer membrane protein [Belliella filtrata]
MMQGCEEFLNEKPQKSLLIPDKLEDLQALLDDELTTMNLNPGIQVIASDELWISDGEFNSLNNAAERNAYIWASEVYEGFLIPDWENPYEQIFYSNVVLDQLENIERNETNRLLHDAVRGSALFYRTMAYTNLIQLFAPEYDPLNADELIGLVIKPTPNIEDKAFQISLKASYEMLIADLMEALNLLPQEIVYKSRPSQPAVLALLARLYLNMEDFAKSEEYALRCIDLYNNLLDYNDVNSSLAIPFPRFNDEVIFHSSMPSYGFYRTAKINIELYNSYEENDLRRQLFFTTNAAGERIFKGWYTGQNRLFGGIATDEVYFIVAESKVRNGKTAEGLEYLNNLLLTRWKEGTFEPTVSLDSQEALKTILEERRKGLVLRGLRWQDIRRLNRISDQPLDLKRIVNGQEYMLEAGSSRFTFPIPDIEIEVNNLIQNER